MTLFPTDGLGGRFLSFGTAEGSWLRLSDISAISVGRLSAFRRLLPQCDSVPVRKQSSTRACAQVKEEAPNACKQKKSIKASRKQLYTSVGSFSGRFVTRIFDN